ARGAHDAIRWNMRDAVRTRADLQERAANRTARSRIRGFNAKFAEEFSCHVALQRRRVHRADLPLRPKRGRHAAQSESSAGISAAKSSTTMTAPAALSAAAG